ncbi:hypothetical protein [Aureivirga sp. CE67]|uniref:hypothetical protein n=1 Tax=Aureivirga sp. CE67 TaxID=1788983 RepID=UPI0018C9E049|nr:hypothetical protein [Aureivirga sp. CE67]
MKKNIIIIILIAIPILLWNFRSSLNSEPILNHKDYPNSLEVVKNQKDELRKSKFNTEEFGNKFIDLIDKQIFPYWYGTHWDYNGITETPNKGSIACGYFVTTTLRDMGVPIKRVKMAQAASEKMIKTLVSKENIYRFSYLNINEFERELNKIGDGLYIVGLDNHTGFILSNEKGDFFIHSSGYYPWQVVKEKLSNSKFIIQSKYRVIGKISSDKKFISSWVNSN